MIFDSKENGPKENFVEVDNQVFGQWFKYYVELLEYAKNFTMEMCSVENAYSIL